MVSFELVRVCLEYFNQEPLNHFAQVIQEKSLSIQVECPSDVTISLTIQNVSTLQEILERVLDKLGRSRHGSSIPVLKVSRYCCLPRS